MIVDLPNTTISKVSKKLVQIREDGGAVALGRVLTLLIETDFKGIERAIQAANEASREHPCRVIVLADDDAKSKKDARLDAQIRVGGDAGASEVIVLRAYGEAASDPEDFSWAVSAAESGESEDDSAAAQYTEEGGDTS